MVELIGKGSEQVTDESMIEVQSGNQKLRTAYETSFPAACGFAPVKRRFPSG
jgi:hypothetical protein